MTKRSIRGSLRHEFPNLKVNLATPDKEIHIEIRADEAYLYDNVTKAVGGLPLGVEGRSSLSSRGVSTGDCRMDDDEARVQDHPAVLSRSIPFSTNFFARAERVVEVLAKYQPGIRLTVIRDSYLAAEQELVRRNLEKYTCIFCKRRMYRIATAFAQQAGAKGMVTGESLGQVASQTLDNLLVLTDAASEVPIHRPLIGFDKEETIEIARGDRDICRVHLKGIRLHSSPGGPVNKSKVATIREIEDNLEATKMQLPYDWGDPCRPRGKYIKRWVFYFQHVCCISAWGHGNIQLPM